MTRPAPTATLVLLAAATALAGCGSDGPLDALSSANPFKQEERLLPGERQAVFTGSDPIAEATGRPAAVGPAVARADWPQPGGTASNDPGHVAGQVAGVRAWAVRAGRSQGAALGVGAAGIRLSARPVAAGGLVYTYDPSGNVSAHALSSGATAWSANVRPAGETTVVGGGGVAADGGRLFVATGFGEAVALDAATGARAWTTRISAPARGTPTAAGGRVYVVGQDGTVTALDQASGAVAWTTPTSGRGAGLLAAASPAVAGERIIVPTSSGDILALSAADGKQEWGASVIGGSRQAAVTGLRDASASPVVADGTVYATGVGGRTIAVSLATGASQWESTIGGVHTPVVSGNAVFVVDLEDRLVAFDRKDGTVLWAVRLPAAASGRSAFAGPVLVGGRLWLVAADGRLVSADAADGAPGPAGALGIGGGIAPITAGGSLVVLGSEGTLVAVR